MKVCTKCKIEKDLSSFSKHKSNKDGMQYRCKDCVKAYNNINKDHIAACGKEWRSANIDYKNMMDREYRESKPWIIKNWRMANKDHIRNYSIKYKLENADRCAEWLSAWRAANPDAVAGHHRTRRSRKSGSNGSHTSADVRAIFESQRGLCASCSVKLIKSGKNRYHVDHIMPLALGGSSDKYNLQCLCPKCNLRKSAKDPIDWARENRKLI